MSSSRTLIPLLTSLIEGIENKNLESKSKSMVGLLTRKVKHLTRVYKTKVKMK
jgi:hypothetical protein